MSSPLLVRSQTPDADGRVLHVEQGGTLSQMGFEVFKLAPGQSLARQTGPNEVCLVPVIGTCQIHAGNQTFNDVGERTTVFEGIKPTAVYVPNDSNFEVTAVTELELAIGSAAGKGTYPVRLITPDDVDYAPRGKGTNLRHIYNILPDTAEADSLLVVEVITPGGHWSSYPPHKHDTDDYPNETFLEETYYHHLNPSQGFAFQRVYTDDRSLDETISVQDGDTVMVPAGYHPVGAPHGYDLYYLNVMAGPVRQWRFTNDPDHDWIMNKD